MRPTSTRHRHQRRADDGLQRLQGREHGKAKDSSAPARYIIQGTKGYLLQKSTANYCGGVTFHPNEGKEEHYNLNAGRPRQAAEFDAFARAIEGGGPGAVQPDAGYLHCGQPGAGNGPPRCRHPLPY